MSGDISRIVDDCLARLGRGETLEQCLAAYPGHRTELEPLLKVAARLSTLPRVAPSEEYKRASQTRVLERIRSDAVRESESSGLFPGWLRHGFSLRPFIPVALVIVVVLTVLLTLPRFAEPAYAADCTLSILAGGAEVQTDSASAWLPGSDGMKLEGGSRVRASPASVVVLTFFDGSTTKLEPGAELAVKELAYVGQREVRIELEQGSGRTWSHVVPDDPKPYFAIRTPQGLVTAKGTSFSTEVWSSGITSVAVTEGVVTVSEQGKDISVAADEYVQLGASLAQAAATAATGTTELAVATAPPGIGSVRDPSGASTGCLPSGIAFNQITNSKSLLGANGQTIEIAEPTAGEYTIAVRALSEEAIPVSVALTRDGVVVFQHTEMLQGMPGDAWIVLVNLDPASTTKSGVTVVSVKPLVGTAPETVVQTDLAKKRAVPVSPTSVQSVPVPAVPLPAPTAVPAPLPTTTTKPAIKPSIAPAPPGTTPLTAEPTQSATTTAPEPTVKSAPTATTDATATPTSTTTQSPSTQPTKTQNMTTTTSGTGK